MDPVFRITEFYRVCGHHLSYIFQIFPNLLQHFLFRCGPDFIVRFTLAEITGQRLFADNMFAGLGSFQHQRKMEGVWNDQIHHLYGRVIQNIAVVIVVIRHIVSFCKIFCPGFCFTGNCRHFHRHSLNLAVGAKMKRTGKSGSNDSDFYGLAHTIFTSLFMGFL